MKKLIMVSNRLPISVTKKEEALKFYKSTGGLATGLSSFYRNYESKWIGWPGITSEKISKEDRKKIRESLLEENCYPVFISQSDLERYYYGFSNKTIWPLFHYFIQYAVFNKNFWEGYRKVNRTFAEEVVEFARKDAIIWIHDYHLMLLPRMIREKLPDASIGFFFHIPFPSFEVFRLLPWRNEILHGLLGADLIGFHSYDYARHFLSCIHRLLGYEHMLGQINVEDRIVRVDAFPMGIDFDKFAGAVKKPEIQKEAKRIKKKIGDRKMILSVDRLDYTKGIPQRLECFDLFLERNSEYREKVTLILVAVPSRTGVEHYQILKRQIEELVGKVNGRHGTIGWVPVWYLYRPLPFNKLVALYSAADVALVTPMRDGMNLISKEYIATKVDGRGVLILSERAGAASELGEAIIVNPDNREETVRAIKEALTMPEEEQIERNRTMQERLKRYNVTRWAQEFIDRLEHTKELQRALQVHRITPQVRKRIIGDYSKATRRLLLLDYDGTLVPFAGKPSRAQPDPELRKLLGGLTSDRRNEVVIISGRDRKTLDNWFGPFDVNLVGEHGVWIKERGEDWRLIEPLKNDWKEEIRPILELFTDRTPGSFIEEKEYSLVWHYRRANPELAVIRSRELKETLLDLTQNRDIGVLEGNKVIEVKKVGISKGKAALNWLEKENWDFILAIGDDWTDEDVFEVLPEKAYSVKVGFGFSRAAYRIESPEKVRELLGQLGGKSDE